MKKLRIIIVLNFVALCISIFWAILDFGFEPLTVTIAFLANIIGIYFSDKEIRNTNKQFLAEDIESLNGKIKFENNEQFINPNNSNTKQSAGKKIKAKKDIVFSGNKQKTN